jgi:hypothetical protein
MGERQHVVAEMGRGQGIGQGFGRRLAGANGQQVHV